MRKAVILATYSQNKSEKREIREKRNPTKTRNTAHAAQRKKRALLVVQTVLILLEGLLRSIHRMAAQQVGLFYPSLTKGTRWNTRGSRQTKNTISICRNRFTRISRKKNKIWPEYD